MNIHTLFSSPCVNKDCLDHLNIANQFQIVNPHLSSTSTGLNLIGYCRLTQMIHISFAHSDESPFASKLHTFYWYSAEPKVLATRYLFEKPHILQVTRYRCKDLKKKTSCITTN